MCLVTQSCQLFADNNHLDYCLLGSPSHGILQARIPEWVAISSSRGSSWPSDWACVSCLGRWICYHWATVEAINTALFNKDWCVITKTNQQNTPTLTSRGGFSLLSLNHTWGSAQTSVTAELTYGHSCCKVVRCTNTSARKAGTQKVYTNLDFLWLLLFWGNKSCYGVYHVAEKDQIENWRCWKVWRMIH